LPPALLVAAIGAAHLGYWRHRASPSQPQIPAWCLNCGGRRLVRLDAEVACATCGSTLEVIE
jgi:hypothetical protein